MTFADNVLSHHGKKTSFVLKLLVALSIPLLSQQSNAATFQKQVILPFLVEFDSNPLMASNNVSSIWRYSVNPRLKLDVDTELSNWYLDANLLVQRNSNNNILADREDPALTLGWKRTQEFGSFGIKADYNEVSSRTTELKDTGVISKDGTTRTKSIAADWTHSITEKLLFGLRGSYSEITYGGVSLADHDLSAIGTTFTYTLSERAEPFLDVGYIHYDPNGGENVDLTTALIGVNYKAKENLIWHVRGGVGDLTGFQSRTPWIGGVGADYMTERTVTAFDISRSLDASAIGGFIESDNLKLGWTYNITERNRAGADFSWYKSRPDNKLGNDEFRFYQLGGYFERDISNNWLMRATLQRKESELLGANAHANVVGFTLIYNSLNF